MITLPILIVLRAFSAGPPADPAITVQDLPMECRRFASLPDDARGDTMAWNQLLSLASCLQDNSIEPVATADDLEVLVRGYSKALIVPTMIYISALEHGPGPVQLRAAYQLGMAHVALAVRARSSVPPSLRVQLEPLLARSLRLAWLTFAVIDRAVAEDATLATDPVTQNALRSARAMLRVLPTPPDAMDADLRISEPSCTGCAPRAPYMH